MERERLLTRVLKLERERGDDSRIAQTLRDLSGANRGMGLYEEGIRQAREALKIFGRLGNTMRQAECLNFLAWLLYGDEQFDTAEEAASHAINLLEKGEQYLVCGSHRILGNIYHSKGKREKAISHLEVAFGIASSFNWHEELFRVHSSLALLFFDGGGFDDAHAHIE